MKVKSLVVGFICLLSLSCLSNKSYANFYVGVESGPVLGNFQYQYFSTVNHVGGVVNPTILSILNVADLYSTVIGSGIYLGYGSQIGRAYLGVEFHSIFEKINLTNIGIVNNPIPGTTPVSLTTTSNIELENDYGFDFRPGYFLSPNTFIYGRFGVAVSRLSLNSNFETNTPTAAGSQYDQISHSVNRYEAGFRVGLGFESFITRYFTWHIEYLYTNYPTLRNFEGQNTRGAPFPTRLTNDTSAALITHSVFFGLTYYFKGFNLNKVMDSSQEPFTCFNGFYVGVQGGIVRNFYQQSFDANTVFPTIAGLALYFGQSDSAMKVSGFGGAHLGYGHNIRRFYLGIHLDADFTRNYALTSLTVDNVANHNLLTVNERFVLQNPYGVSMRFGFVITKDILFFTEIGMYRALLKLASFNADRLDVGGGLFETIVVPVNGKREVTGLNLGLGFILKLYRHFGLTLKYQYVNFGSMLIAANQAALAGPIALASEHESRVAARNQILSLGFSYYFSG